MPRMSRADTRISQFDGLRAFAFLGVFFHHALKMSLGWMGVDLFFVLSGFLITRILLDFKANYTLGSSLATFYFRRLIRIVPAYYLVVTFVLLFTSGYQAGWYYGFASNIRDAFYGGDDGPLRTMWSIAVEEQFYVVWPMIVLLLPRRFIPAAFITLIFAAPLCRLGVQDVAREAVYRLTTSRMDLLAAGALLAYVDVQSPAWIERHRRLFGIAAIAAAALFLGLTVGVKTFRSQLNDPFFNVAGYSLAVVLCTSTIAHVRALTDGPLFVLLRLPVLQYVGRISYVAYLVHLFFLQFFQDEGFTRVAVALLSLAATLSFASISWYVIEKPLLGLRRFVPPRPKAISVETA